jgi:MbtH protein
MSHQDVQVVALFDVVQNSEEQYSIWPSEKAMPLGWVKAGKQGSREDCLDYIRDVWTDMRPLSLRKHMLAAATS